MPRMLSRTQLMSEQKVRNHDFFGASRWHSTQGIIWGFMMESGDVETASNSCVNLMAMSRYGGGGSR